LLDLEAEPEAIAHHFTQAGLDGLAIEWWGKAGDQALRRSAFQEAISHLGKAIAMADKMAGGQAAGVSGQRQQLHAAYGNALIAVRGFGAPETMEAFAKVRETAYGDKDAPERLAADFGLWAGSFTRGELPSMRALAATFLADVQERPESAEAGVAHSVLGATHWFAGEYVEARDPQERALALFEPGRDDDLAFRFGFDAGVAAMLYLGLTLWPLGDVERAISLMAGAEARTAGLAHIGTHAFARTRAGMFELMRGDVSRAAQNGVELARLAREHDLPLWRACGVFLEGLALTVLAIRETEGPLTAGEALRELLHDAAEFMLGWDCVAPLKAQLGAPFRQLEARLQAAVEARYRLPPWTAEDYAKHKRADRLAAASEAFHVVGWSRTDMVKALGIEIHPLLEDPLSPNRFAPWEPWPPRVAERFFAKRLRKLGHGPRSNTSSSRTRAFGRPTPLHGGDHAASF
jgi:tetratricopeptide (TPR) repeat protein